MFVSWFLAGLFAHPFAVRFPPPARSFVCLLVSFWFVCLLIPLLFVFFPSCSFVCLLVGLFARFVVDLLFVHEKKSCKHLVHAWVFPVNLGVH